MKSSVGLWEGCVAHHVDFDDRAGDVADAETEDKV